MNYKGRLFGKVGKKYIELDVTTKFTDDLINKVAKLESENNRLTDLMGDAWEAGWKAGRDEEDAKSFEDFQLSNKLPSPQIGDSWQNSKGETFLFTLDGWEKMEIKI